MIRRVLMSLAISLALAACSQSERAAAERLGSEQARAEIGAWGVDLSARDPGVAPGNDFFAHANGKWLASAEIPADRTAWGAFHELDAKAEQQVREIAESLPADAPEGSVEQKVGDFYRAYLDTAAIEQVGLEPLKPAFSAIEGARTHAQIAELMGRPDMPVISPIGVYISMDEKNPDRYITYILQSGLGLPDREYYLRDDEQFAAIRKEYLAHIERMLALAGEKNAAAQAKTILDLETGIAKVHWPVEKRRERDITYNLRTREQLEKQFAGFPWTQALTAAGLDSRREFVVAELDAVQQLSRLFGRTPVDAWRSYLKYHYLVNVADVLPKAIDDESFAFYGKVLNGQPQQRERWKRAVDALDSGIGEGIGQLYVARHFPPESKQKMLDLVENLRIAYGQRIRGLKWMSEETKKVALEKLEAFRPKIGYPDQWRDYAALEVRPDDAFGNKIRANAFEWNREVARIDQPTDREEWGMTPQTVNAYYNSTFNEVVFPAAILQPPFFDPNADPAVNYGAIGGVIGHEMGHGFDDQGAKSDAQGILRTWWRPEDEESFKKLVDGLAEQYSQYEVLPGLKVNGRLTLGENIGDLGGLSVAHEAYKLSLDGEQAPVLDDLTGDQRFFFSWAQVWRTLMRDERLRNQVLSDPHSPAKFRVNGVVRNMDAWYEAFDVQPDNALFLPPEQRVRIW